jgi:hypothetical protein
VILGQDDDSAAEKLPLSAIQGSFMLNSFPWAQMVIPVGKPADEASEENVQRARALAESLKQFKVIEAWVQLEGEFAPGVSWPTAPFKVFNGLVTGTSTVRSLGTISVVVHATHWLIDLDASSALSDDVVTGAPVALKLPAVTGNLASSGRDPEDPLLKKMGEDLWIAALKPKFVEICTGGSILTQLACGPPELRTDRRATNDTALPRLADGSAAGAFDISALVDVPKMEMVEALDLALRGSISQATSKRLYNGSLGTSTLWDKLLEVAHLFQFSIVPTVDTAVCAPISPCLAGEISPRHVTIKASEYHTFKPSEALFRVWRGVSVSGHFSCPLRSADENVVQDYEFLTSSGCYLADQDESLPDDVRARAARGMVQFVEAPDWVMDKSMEAALNARLSIDGMNNSMRDVEEGPEAEDETAEPAARDAEPKRDAALAKRLGDAYAKWWYWVHQFLPRTGELTGKLRFDIAPGSIVRIEDIDGKLYDDPADFGYLYAMVTSVRFQIDAVNASASTSLTLSHIRREGEKLYGTSGHPLYKSSAGERWVGTVLQRLQMVSGGANAASVASTFVPEPGQHEVA